MRTIADLMLLVAKHLSGRACDIDFAGQVYSGVNGHMRKSLTGRPVITVSGDLDREQYIKTFLHELAHVRLHFHKLTPTARPQKQTYTGAALAAKDQREQEAKALADKWLSYADRRADDLEGRLWALAKYQTT